MVDILKRRQLEVDGIAAEVVEYVSTDFIRSRIPLGNQQRYDVGRIDGAENYRPDEYQYQDFAASKNQSLKESIYNNGIREPIEIFIHKDGSVALGEGHHRLQAATELGFKSVPVIVKVGRPSPKIGTYDSPEPFSKINISGLKPSGEMRFSDVDFDGRGLPIVKTEGTETHKFLQFDREGISTGELGPAKSPSKYTAMRSEFINKNVSDGSEKIIEVYPAPSFGAK